MALTITAQRVPKEYRNKRIYYGAVTVSVGGLAGGGGAGSAYTAGNGITVAVNIISLDTNFIEVTPAQGVKLKYNNITELEVISGGIDIKNILKAGTINERVADAGITIPCQLGVGTIPLAGFAGVFRSASTAAYAGNNLYVQDNRVLAANTGGGITFGGIYTDVDGYTSGGFIRIQKEDAVTGHYGYDLLIGNRIDGASPAAQLMIAASDGRVRINQSMDSMDTTFASGFTGAGWKLLKTGSGGSATYSFEVDNLRVRGSMTVYELILNQIRATNGSLWVSDAARIETSDTGTTYDYDITVDVDGGNNPIPFAVNDLLRCQKFDGRNVKYYVLQVKTINASAGTMSCDNVTGAGVPTGSDTLVRMGNTATAARQNAIYLTASDTNNPYIEILSGVNSGTASLAGFSKARLGNLTGITDATFGALSGYGLWSDNIYLTGKINATTGGLIAGWDITGDYIRKNYMPGQYDWLYMSHAGGGELPSGFGLVMGSSAGVGEVRSVHMGELHVKDDHDTVATGEFGFEIIKKTGSSTYAHMVRICQDEAMIAGWKIDPDAIYTGTKKIDAGFNDNTGLSLVSDGAIHSPNFYVDADGDVGFRGKEIIYAYIGVSDNIIHSHDAIEARVNKTYTKVKTITLGSNIQGIKTLRITFDLKVSDDTYFAYGRIYKNGNPIGVEQYEYTETWDPKPQDIPGWVAGDDIELHIKISGGTIETAQIQNFRVCGEQAVQVNEITGENTFP